MQYDHKPLAKFVKVTEGRQITEAAATVVGKRIARQDADKNPLETWPQVCDRVSTKIVQAEKPEDRKAWQSIFKTMMEKLIFLPNSPALKNFGANNGCGSACFVIPIEDSLESIFRQALPDAVAVQAYGGGTGFSFGRLRPEGDLVRSTGGRTCGPIGFAKVYDHAIGDTIAQGGTRHGANMGILPVDHPDIEKFIVCKEQEGVMANFNISVAATDAFMQAVVDGTDYDLVFEGQKRASIPARRVFGKIVDGAWRNGEPGIVFIDAMNRHNHAKGLEGGGMIEATNPCGEQPLLPYESCNLGSLNLLCFVDADGNFDYEALRQAVYVAVRMLDNVIDVNTYPVEKIRQQTLTTRKVGLGVMGFADVLMLMGIRYGAKESVAFAEKLAAFIEAAATEASEALAAERGPAPIFELNPGHTFPFAKRRNFCLTTQAPTGTIGVIAGASAGIEPQFAMQAVKECMEGTKLKLVPYPVEVFWARHGEGAALPPHFIGANEVSPSEHVAVQAAFQKHVDAAVSKTVNLPFSATREQVAEAIMDAWRSGCKGLTLYRDGSRDAQVYTAAGSTGKKAKVEALPRGEVKKRIQKATFGPTVPVDVACGTLYVEPRFDADGLFELFIPPTGKGGCTANLEAVGRLVSTSLRAGVSPEKIAGKLKDVTCSACKNAYNNGRPLHAHSCAAGVAKVLMEVSKPEVYQALTDTAGQMATIDASFAPVVKPNAGRRAISARVDEHEVRRCPDPDCNHPLSDAEGCVVCTNPYCGYSEC